MNQTDNEMPQTKCPKCCAGIDMATTMRYEEAPKPGDYCICFYCAHISIYGDDMQLIELTRAEVIEVASDDFVMQMHSQLVKLIEGREANDLNE